MKETVQEIRELVSKYERLESLVDEKLRRTLMVDGNPMIRITHRIKTMDSIKGKMVRKADSYSSIRDMKDILGVRVICYFSSDVDKVAEQVAECFCVDMSRSKDKRKLIDARSFGYLSVHYICTMPEAGEELGALRFEIQIKTFLQHCWAEIEHDLGYKTEIEVPRDIRRSFSKAASLLETTDDIFSEILRKLDDYESRVARDVKSGRLDKLYFDRLTVREFTAHNRSYRQLLDEIAAITNAHITEGVPDTQLHLIEFLGIETLEDMEILIEEQHDLALKLARKSLEGTELDELISTVAYYYLFRAELISGDYSRERIREFVKLTARNRAAIDTYTEKILREREEFEAG